MKPLPLLLLLLFLTKTVAQNSTPEWQTIKIGETSYISADELKAHYGVDAEVNFLLGSHIAFIHGVKFLTAHPIRKQAEQTYISERDVTTLITPLLQPKPEKQPPKFTTVILDAGHGGHDKGAANKESALSLGLALQIKALLEKQNLKVIMTREKDQFTSLTSRVKSANTHKQAIMVSLHFNSGNKNASGFETYVMSGRTPVYKNNALSLTLASHLHAHALLKLGAGTIKDRGIRRAKFRILKDCIHPSILIEGGFLTHKEESATIQTEQFQKKLAQGISAGIIAFRKTLGN